MCKNQFLESDGFCTQCGQNHFDLKKKSRKRRPVSKPQIPEEIKIKQIQAAIDAEPIFKTVKETAELLIEVFEIPNVRVIFRNIRGSNHRYNKLTQQHLIVFGYECIRYFAQFGYSEYKSIDWIVPRPRPKGVDAAKWLVCHEVAHAIVQERGQRHYGVAHGHDFMNAYAEIRELVF